MSRTAKLEEDGGVFADQQTVRFGQALAGETSVLVLLVMGPEITTNKVRFVVSSPPPFSHAWLEHVSRPASWRVPSHLPTGSSSSDLIPPMYSH